MTDRSRDPLDQALAVLKTPTPPVDLRARILEAAPTPASVWQRWRTAILATPAMAASLAMGVVVGYAQPLDDRSGELEDALSYAFEPSFDFALDAEEGS